MKSLDIILRLSKMANNLDNTPPSRFLPKVQHFLAQQNELFGDFKNSTEQPPHKLNSYITLQQYDLTFEKRALRLKFAFSEPTGTWEIQDFQLRRA